MRADWIECCFEDLLGYEQPTKYIVSNTKYSDKYKTPVLTAGKSFIKGYTNETNDIFSDLPVIIFDDFTTASQFVDFKFKVKSSAMKILNPTCHLINMDFVFFCMQVNRIRNDTHKRYWISVYAKKKISLPPLPEQRAIVRKIEKSFKDLDSSINHLKTAQTQLKTYRQAVLKNAFEGELTKEWRKNNIYNLDSFLTTLKKEKKKCIKLKAISNSEYFPVIDSENAINSIPNNWLLLPWKTITSNNKYSMKRGPFGSALKKEFFISKGIPVYEQFHAINNTTTTHRYYINNKKFKELKAFKVQAGDIIISCSGSLGRICLLPKNAKTGIINQALLKVDLNNAVVLKDYFIMFFKSENFQRVILKTAGSAIQNIASMSKLKEIPIPLPSIQEQTQIVKEIEARLTACDETEKLIADSLIKAEHLRQSILKKAFEGRLLSDAELARCKKDKDYLPASELLKQIKAAKTPVKTKKSTKKLNTPIKKISTDIQAGLIAKVILLHEQNPKYINNLTHVKCEKMTHLVEAHLQIPLGREPVKDAAGPDDYPHLKKVEHRAKMANYFKEVRQKIGHTYQSGNNLHTVIEKFDNALSDEKKSRVDSLLKLFLKFDLESSEIVATLYAGWNNLLIDGKKPTDDEIVFESRENWSKRKLTIEKDRFYKALNWMRKSDIALIPTGYGAKVVKNDK